MWRAGVRAAVARRPLPAARTARAAVVLATPALCWWGASRPSSCHQSDRVLLAAKPSRAAAPGTGLAKVHLFARLVARVAELLWVLAPVALLSPLLALPGFTGSWQERGRDAWWRLLLDSVVSAGPSLIKLCQWASTRPDLFPPEVCTRLSELQSRVAQHGLAETEAILDQELEDWRGKLELGKVVGSGCIGQVYQGRLGTERVAVKVAHPRAPESVLLDLELLGIAARLLGAVPYCRNLGVENAAGTFARFLRDQTDFRVEASNLERLGANFADVRNVTVPQVHQPATARVLVESFEEGTELSALLEGERGEAQGYKRVAKLGMDALLQMLFVDNLLHADMHPGNILVRNRAPSRWFGSDPVPEIVLLDCGLVTTLSERERRSLYLMLHAVLERRTGDAARMFLEWSRGDRSLVKDEALFCASIQEELDRTLPQGILIRQVKISSFFANLMEISRSHSVQLETSFVAMAAGFMVCEGVARSLDPDLDIFQCAFPYVARAASAYTWDPEWKAEGGELKALA